MSIQPQFGFPSEMRVLPLLVTLALALVVLSEAKKKKNKGQPNIVFILADDWGKKVKHLIH